MQHILNSIFNALIFLLIIAALVALLLVGVYINETFFVFIATFLLSLIIVGYFSWVLLSSIWRVIVNYLTKIYNNLNGSLISKLIAFGVAGFFLSFIPIRFVSALLIFISTLLSKLFTQAITTGMQLRGCNILTSRPPNNCIASLLASLFTLWTNSIGEAYSISNISFLPLGELFIFFIIWIILSEVIYQIASVLQKSGKEKSWIEKLYTDPITKSNIIFFIILGASLYLSIAAIAAIPSLQSSELTPEIVNVESLEKRFESSMTQFKRQFPIEGDTGFNTSSHPLNILKSSEVEPLINLKNMVEREKAKLSQKTNTSNNKNIGNLPISLGLDEKDIDFLESFLIAQTSYRNPIINQANELLSLSRETLQNMALDAITEYKYAGVGRKGSRETVDHFLSITNWFDTNLSQMQSQINACLSTIKAGDRKFKTTVDSLTTYLYGSETIPLGNESFLSNQWSDAWESCRIQPSFQQIPRRSALGAYLGIFGFIASWLLSTESLSLALITGLLGFGLLGSACSSFVRERLETGQEQPSVPLVKDLPKVIIIGLSAAILAFLAVMGGLAVFFSTGSNPNPYALLLACLVAAAFGENVWQWARGKLQENLKESNDKSDKSSD